MGEVSEDWRGAKPAHLLKGGKEDLGNYRPVSLMSIPKKILQLMIKWNTCEHLENNGVISRSLCGFTKNKLAESNQNKAKETLSPLIVGLSSSVWLHLQLQ